MSYQNAKLAGLQVQFWDAESKSYAPSTHQGDLTADNARMVACGRPWRLCKPDRPTKNPKYRPLVRAGSIYTIAKVQARYCEWAQAKGLTQIHAFEGKPLALGNFKGAILRVDPDKYFQVRN